MKNLSKTSKMTRCAEDAGKNICVSTAQSAKPENGKEKRKNISNISL